MPKNKKYFMAYSKHIGWSIHFNFFELIWYSISYGGSSVDYDLILFACKCSLTVNLIVQIVLFYLRYLLVESRTISFLNLVITKSIIIIHIFGYYLTSVWNQDVTRTEHSSFTCQEHLLLKQNQNQQIC